MNETKKFYKDWKNLCKQVVKDKTIRYAQIAYKGNQGNSENDWGKIRNPIKMLFTAAIFEILRKTPPCRIKNAIYRMFGVKIGKDVAIAYNVLFDPLFPELITIDDNVMIGSDVEFGTHVFVNSYFGIGRILVKKNTMIGAYALIGGGVTIGEGAVTGAYSFIKSDIPNYEFWAGLPAKKIKDLPKEGLKLKKDLEITRYE